MTLRSIRLFHDSVLYVYIYLSIAIGLFAFRLMLASADGYFYIYNIPELGGDCEMVKQHRVDPECSEDAASGSQPSLTPPDSPAVMAVTQEEHSSCQDDSPPPTVQNPE